MNPRQLTPRQLTLDLPHRPAFGMEDFLVAPSNSEAVAWLDRWPDWPAAGLALYGPAGCGKSHLLAVWRARSGGRSLAPDDLPAPGSLPPNAHVAIDDAADGLADEARQTALFHLYNELRAGGGTLLLASAEPPARWNVGLPDLASRLAALPAAEVTQPDDELIAAVLIKLFADRQLAVPASVIEYLAARMERSFEAARRLVDALDREALSRGRKITRPLAAEVLGALDGRHSS